MADSHHHDHNLDSINNDTNANEENDMEEAAARLSAELDILYAMYPDNMVTYFPRGRELRYTAQSTSTSSSSSSSPSSSSTGTLTLRLPEMYPVSGFPEVLTASMTTTPARKDLRDQTKAAFRNLGFSTAARAGVGGGGGGEEVLDALILAFQELIDAEAAAGPAHCGDDRGDGAKEEEGKRGAEATVRTRQSSVKESTRQHKTVVIWLHHLLNTNKRKLALHPSTSSHDPATKINNTRNNNMTGVTKPGYPGVLVYSGPRALVDAHVAELKAQRWQAFQVRYDSDDDADDDQDYDSSRVNGSKSSAGFDKHDNAERQRQRGAKDTAVMKEEEEAGLWQFEHSAGTIVEVESIALAARCISQESHREIFLSAVGVK